MSDLEIDMETYFSENPGFARFAAQKSPPTPPPPPPEVPLDFDPDLGDLGTTDQTLWVFCDGSWKDGYGGAGIASYSFRSKGWLGRSLALGPVSDPGSSECERQALTWCLKEAWRWRHSYKDVRIATDNLGCAGAEATKAQVRDLNQRSDDFSVTVYWVRSHSGVRGNELADRLATNGRLRSVAGDSRLTESFALENGQVTDVTL